MADRWHDFPGLIATALEIARAAVDTATVHRYPELFPGVSKQLAPHDAVALTATEVTGSTRKAQPENRPGLLSTLRLAAGVLPVRFGVHGVPLVVHPPDPLVLDHQP